MKAPSFDVGGVPFELKMAVLDAALRDSGHCLHHYLHCCCSCYHHLESEQVQATTRATILGFDLVTRHFVKLVGRLSHIIIETAECTYL